MWLVSCSILSNIRAFFSLSPYERVPLSSLSLARCPHSFPPSLPPWRARSLSRCWNYNKKAEYSGIDILPSRCCSSQVLWSKLKARDFSSSFLLKKYIFLLYKSKNHLNENSISILKVGSVFHETYRHVTRFWDSKTQNDINYKHLIMRWFVDN